MDIITQLKHGNSVVKKLYVNFLNSVENDTEYAQKIIFNILDQLKIHAKIQEKFFYPLLETNEQTRELIQASYKVHTEIKQLVSDLSALPPQTIPWKAKVKLLYDAVFYHAHEEETQLYPVIENILSKKLLQHAGQNALNIKKTALEVLAA